MADLLKTMEGQGQWDNQEDPVCLAERDLKDHQGTSETLYLMKMSGNLK